MKWPNVFFCIEDDQIEKPLSLRLFLILHRLRFTWRDEHAYAKPMQTDSFSETWTAWSGAVVSLHESWLRDELLSPELTL